MKLNKFFMSLLGALALTACSSDDNQPANPEDGGLSKPQTNYLSVKVAAPQLSSRAAAGYQDGTEDENHVTNIRFYFFTAEGEAAYIKFNGTERVNYYDYTVPTGGQKPSDNSSDDIESIVNAVIVIDTKQGDRLPGLIAAVINSPSDHGVTRSISDLKKVMRDYAAPQYTQKGKFVMFNSVYANGTNEINTTTIDAKHLQKTEEDAKKNPVTIYVERNVAKVEVTVDNQVYSNGKIALKNKEGQDLIIDGKQVYLQINGCHLTAETTVGNLVKDIKTEWTGTWWNNPEFFRSCWAVNASNAENKYYTYEQVDGTGNKGQLAIGTPIYTNENAADYESAQGQTKLLNRTKVMLNGTLVDEDGEPLTIVKHGATFIDKFSGNEAENLPLLKSSILNQLNYNRQYYYDVKDNTGKVTGRSQISIEDLKIVIAGQIEEEESDHNCYVYAQLTDEAAAKTWYNSNDIKATPLEKGDEKINADLRGTDDDRMIDRSLVWKSGQTYYYFSILHNTINEAGNASTRAGVVRNHWYKTNITKIAGLGTPVYNPEEVIYPEKPDPTEYYIAAEINILSWHLQRNNYELEW